MNRQLTLKLRMPRPVIRMKLRTYIQIRDTALALYDSRWLIAATLWCMVIFAFSHQPGPQSASLSSSLSGHLGFLSALFKLIPIRSLAHMCLYAVLASLLHLQFQGQRLCPAKTLALCYAYAVTDELHQLFIPGRACQFTDTLFDLSGAAIGLLITSAVCLIVRHASERLWLPQIQP